MTENASKRTQCIDRLFAEAGPEANPAPSSVARALATVESVWDNLHEAHNRAKADATARRAEKKASKIAKLHAAVTTQLLQIGLQPHLAQTCQRSAWYKSLMWPYIKAPSKFSKKAQAALVAKLQEGFQSAATHLPFMEVDATNTTGEEVKLLFLTGTGALDRALRLFVRADPCRLVDEADESFFDLLVDNRPADALLRRACLTYRLENSHKASAPDKPTWLRGNGLTSLFVRLARHDGVITTKEEGLAEWVFRSRGGNESSAYDTVDKTFETQLLRLNTVLQAARDYCDPDTWASDKEKESLAAAISTDHLELATVFTGPWIKRGGGRRSKGGTLNLRNLESRDFSALLRQHLVLAKAAAACIHGDGRLLLCGAESTAVLVRDVRAGMRVQTGDGAGAVVTCVTVQARRVREMCQVNFSAEGESKYADADNKRGRERTEPNRQSVCCGRSGACWLTPKHPVRWRGRWVAAEDVAPRQLHACDVYNFVLSRGHSLVVDGQEVLTLAHEGRDAAADIGNVGRSVWGTRGVLRYLKKQPGFPRVVISDTREAMIDQIRGQNLV